MEKRSGALIDIEKKQLERQMQMYYDPQVGWEKLVALQTGLTKEAASYDPRAAGGREISIRSSVSVCCEAL